MDWWCPSVCPSVCCPHLVNLCVKILEFAFQSGNIIFRGFLFIRKLQNLYESVIKVLTNLFTFRRFAVKRCSRCGMGITANELVMRAKDFVYHLQCFTCASCNKTLTTGDQFGMKEHLIYCRHDYEILFQGEFFPVMNHGIPCGPGSHLPYFSSVGNGVQKGRPRKRKNLSLDPHEGCPPGMGKRFRCSISPEDVKNLDISWHDTAISRYRRLANMYDTCLNRRNDTYRDIHLTAVAILVLFSILKIFREFMMISYHLKLRFFLEWKISYTCISYTCI